MTKRIFPEGMGFLEALNIIIRAKPKNWKKSGVKKKPPPLRKKLHGE